MAHPSTGHEVGNPFGPAAATLSGGGRPDDVLRRLELSITHRLDGLLQGNYLGLVPGHGTELGETRRYAPGDDVRRIDWNVTARMQEPYIRQTIADRELESWLIVDRSASLDFGTAACEKADLALAASAAIGFLTNHTGNRIGATLLEPTGDRMFPARGGRRHLMSMLHTISSSPRSETGSTDLAASLRRLSGVLRRRGLVVIISDFLDDGAWERPLRTLAVRHEVLAIEIVDPREMALPDVGMLALVDPETGRLLHVDTTRGRTRERFAEAAVAQRAEIAERITSSGAGHLQLRTDSDWLRELVRYVARRRAHRGTMATARITQ